MGSVSEGRKCGADGKNGPCKNPAGLKTDHPGFGRCYRHFGATPAVSKAAAKEKVLHLAGKACKALNLDVDYSHVSAEQALIEEVRRSYAIVAWFDDKLGGKTEADLTQALIDDDGRIEGITVQTWFQLYHQERAHAAKVYALAISAGVAAAHLALLQTQASDLAKAIRVVLDGLGLTPKQADLAPQLLRRALEAIPVAALEA